MAKVLDKQKVKLINNNLSTQITIPRDWATQCGLDVKRFSEADIFLVLTKHGYGVHVTNKKYQDEYEKMKIEL